MLTPVLALLVFHGIIGGADVLLNHEWRERLPAQVWARPEQALHSARELVFAAIFGGLAWLEWGGALVWALVALVLLEFSISLTDTLLEDRTRPLSALERTMHVVLLVNFGAYNALLVTVLLEWHALPTGFRVVHHGFLTWLLTALSLAAFAWCLRDALSYVWLGKRIRQESGLASA
ncbi:hypothetical protein [Noviherbaspirillum sp. ST9]|uniref:hypothetical protein n=1 Tax=Noviherbaspirillum sp. ST9 TaxID=3401606 RepID=UPI003B5865E3